MGELSWQAQIHHALLVIDHRGEAAPAVQHRLNSQLEQANFGIYRYGTFALVLVILDVRRCLQLFYGAEQLLKLLAANNLVEIVRAVSAADTIGLSHHADWIKQALTELQDADGANLKVRKIERSPRE